MSSSKVRSIWVGIGALLLVGVVVAVIGLASSGGTSRGAVYSAPVPTTVGAGANARAPKGGSHAPLAPASTSKPGGTPAAPVTQTETTRTEAPAPAATAKGPPAGTPQANGGDSDPDNNGGPDDGDGAI